MSRLRVNKLTNKNNDGAPEFIHGASVTGVVTATAFKGDGSELTGVSADTAILNSGVPSGSASSINFGNNISVDSVANGVASISAPPGLSVKENGQTPIDAVSSLSFDPSGFTVTNSGGGEAFVQNSAGVGINSTGTSIATNVNTLNFVGAGNTFSYDSANNTVNISIASGGGGSSSSSGGYVVTDHKTFASTGGWYNSSTYSSSFRTDGGLKNNKFFSLRGEYKGSSSSGQTRLQIDSFSVSPTTGAISHIQSTQPWTNSSYAGWSTTYWISPDGSGAFFYGGNIAWPGYTSHYQGYGYGHVNSSGNYSGGSYSKTDGDHGYNGMITALPSTGNQYILSAGYHQSYSYRAMSRASYWNGSSWSIGSSNNLGSDTSTTYSGTFISSPDYTASGNNLVSAIWWRGSNTAYYLRTIAANGNQTNHSFNNWDSSAVFYQMNDGSVIMYSSQGNYRFSDYANKSSLSATYPYPTSTYIDGEGLGNNKFILPLNTSSAAKNNTPLLLAQINPSNGTLTALEFGPEAKMSDGFYPLDGSYTRFFTVWANSSATTPSHIVFIANRGYAKTEVMTVEWPFTTPL